MSRKGLEGPENGLQSVMFHRQLLLTHAPRGGEIDPMTTQLRPAIGSRTAACHSPFANRAKIARSATSPAPRVTNRPCPGSVNTRGAFAPSCLGRCVRPVPAEESFGGDAMVCPLPAVGVRSTDRRRRGPHSPWPRPSNHRHHVHHVPSSYGLSFIVRSPDNGGIRTASHRRCGELRRPPASSDGAGAATEVGCGAHQVWVADP